MRGKREWFALSGSDGCLVTGENRPPERATFSFELSTLDPQL
jgi:hypothetical protein